MKRYSDTIVKIAWDYKDRRVPKEILRTVAYIYSIRYDRVRNDLKKAAKSFEED